MGFIYKVENTANGKVYVGQTRYSVEWRWHTHLYSAFSPQTGDHNSPFHRAIRKYGIDSFFVETVEECDVSELNSREMFWVSFYNSLVNENGYNVSIGGGGYRKHDDSEIKHLWDAGYSASEISRLYSLPIGRNTVRLRLLGMGVSEDEIRKRGNEAIARSKEKMIYQYSLNGEYMKSYYSARIASHETGIHLSNLAACAAGNIKSAGGYLWSYEKKRNVQPLKKNSGHTLVGKYSLEGQLIQAYVSITAAAKYNNISRKRLSIACDNEEIYQNAKWKFLPIERGVIHV